MTPDTPPPQSSAPLARNESLGYLVNHLARQLAIALRDELASHGVVPGQFAQLLALYEHDGLTQTQLCELVQIEQPTMANTLARMQRDGLITKVADPDDGRRSLIMLTDHAHSIQADLVAAARRVNATATHDLDHGQLEAFLATTSHLIANLTTPTSQSAAS